MPVAFQNFEFSYLNAKKKPVFVPSEEGRKIGLQVKALVEKNFAFESFFWHLRDLGHVGALHSHRGHRWFARVDLKNFFYTVRRRQVQQALKVCGVKRHEHFAKWSTVRNPYEGGGYVVPYGFVQSPILASLVLAQSKLGQLLCRLDARVTVGVYLDDISLSSNDRDALDAAWQEIIAVIEPSGFLLNADKATSPAFAIELFNCDLTKGYSTVLETRRADFYAVPRTEWSEAGFEDYCSSVERGNDE